MGAEIILPNGQVRNLADDAPLEGDVVGPYEQAGIDLEDAPPALLLELVGSGGLPFVKVVVNPETGDVAVASAGLTPEDIVTVFQSLASLDPAEIAGTVAA